MTHTLFHRNFIVIIVGLLFLGIGSARAACPDDEDGYADCHIPTCSTFNSGITYPITLPNGISESAYFCGGEDNDLVGSPELNGLVLQRVCEHFPSPSVTTSRNCSANTIISYPINGTCGSSHGQTLSTTPGNLCATGTPTALSGTGPWSRSCNGLNGGETAACSANNTTPPDETNTCPYCVSAICHDQDHNIANSVLCPLPAPTTGTFWAPVGSYARCPANGYNYDWDIGPWGACSQDTTCNNGGSITSTGYIDRAGDTFNRNNPPYLYWDTGLGTGQGRIYNDNHQAIMGCPFLLPNGYNIEDSSVDCGTLLSLNDGEPSNGVFYQIYNSHRHNVYIMSDIVISTSSVGPGLSDPEEFVGTLWQSRCYGSNEFQQICPTPQPGQENYRENTNIGCNDIDATTLPTHPGTNTVSLCIQSESCELDPSVRTRTVVCRDNGGSGEIVDDSICSQPKPITEDSSTCNINTQCGSANNIPSSTKPMTNLCTTPAVLSGGVTSLNTVRQWQCRTRGILDVSTNTQGWVSSATCSAPQQEIAVNHCGSVHGQTLSSLSSSHTNLCAPGSFLQAGTFTEYSYFWEWHCAGTPNAGVNQLTALCSANKISAGCELDTTVGGGCFIADTIITMADGSSKPIQDIKIGDKLKAVDGINTVVSLLRPLLGNQNIYSINNTDAFFTANHPFLTTDGWKSLDPETTKKEIPDLLVTKLAIGDVLITEDGYSLIMSIGKASSSSSTQLYNFELDGDHTYFANDFAVHNKYESGTEPVDLGSSCTKNSDCWSGVAGASLACDNSTKTCKYVKPYPTFMCQMDSNGNITNWYNYGACGDWAEPNYVGAGCPTNNGVGLTCTIEGQNQLINGTNYCCQNGILVSEDDPSYNNGIICQ